MRPRTWCLRSPTPRVWIGLGICGRSPMRKPASTPGLERRWPHRVRKVADAYTTLRANLRNGRYGKPGSPQRVKVESAPIQFRSLAAQPFDDRCRSWVHDTDTATGGSVSIWTVEGRLKNLRFT